MNTKLNFPKKQIFNIYIDSFQIISKPHTERITEAYREHTEARNRRMAHIHRTMTTRQ